MTTFTDRTVLAAVPSLMCAFEPGSATLRAGGRALRYEGGATALLRRLLPLLDGRRELASVVGELGGERLAPAVRRLCDRLLTDGLVIQMAGGDGAALPTAALTAGAVQGRPVNLDRPHFTALRVVGDPAETAAVEALAPQWRLHPTDWAALAELGETAGDPDVLTVVWTNDPNDPRLAQWNADAYHNRHPWLPISHFDGEVAVVGPLVLAPETPCLECYRRRRAARSSLGAGYLDLRPFDPAPLDSSAMRHLLAAVAVLMLQDWSVRRNPYLPGAVRTVTFDQGLAVGTEYVLRVPRCQGCRPGTDVARPALWSEYPPQEEQP